MGFEPTVLVIGSGGMKVFAFLGALLILEQQQFLKKITTFCGTSAGSLLSLMLISNFTVTEIIEEALETGHLFNDISSISFTNIRKNMGILDHEIFRKKLSQKMEKKFGCCPTMQQLYMFTGLKFVSVTMNIDREQPVYLSHETEPNLSCVDAVLLSINIPGLFYELRYKTERHIDGAFGCPYAVDLFDDGKTDIIGISVGSKVEFLDKDPSSQKKYFDSNSALEYLYKTLTISITQLKRNAIKRSSERVWNIELCSDVRDVTGVSLGIKEKAEMISCGFGTAKQFLASRGVYN